MVWDRRPEGLLPDSSQCGSPTGYDRLQGITVSRQGTVTALAEAYADFHKEVAYMSLDELVSVRNRVEGFTESNCWWAFYRVRHIALGAIEAAIQRIEADTSL